MQPSDCVRMGCVSERLYFGRFILGRVLLPPDFGSIDAGIRTVQLKPPVPLYTLRCSNHRQYPGFACQTKRLALPFVRYRQSQPLLIPNTKSSKRFSCYLSRAFFSSAQQTSYKGQIPHFGFRAVHTYLPCKTRASATSGLYHSGTIFWSLLSTSAGVFPVHIFKRWHVRKTCVSTPI